MELHYLGTPLKISTYEWLLDIFEQCCGSSISSFPVWATNTTTAFPTFAGAKATSCKNKDALKKCCDDFKHIFSKQNIKASEHLLLLVHHVSVSITVNPDPCTWWGLVNVIKGHAPSLGYFSLLGRCPDCLNLENLYRCFLLEVDISWTCFLRTALLFQKLFVLEVQFSSQPQARPCTQ